MKTRHADYERFFQDFLRIRGPLNGPVFYAKFLDAYKLDETISYEVTNRSRLMEYALNSPIHQSIKRQYPRMNFDQYLTGIRKRARLKTEAQTPYQTKVKKHEGSATEIDFRR